MSGDKKIIRIALLALALSAPACAQCVMCYRTAQAQSAARARALNLGIVVLGVPPVLILTAFIAYAFTRDG